MNFRAFSLSKTYENRPDDLFSARILFQTLAVTTGVLLLTAAIFAVADDTLIDPLTRHFFSPLLVLLCAGLSVSMVEVVRGRMRVARILSLSAVIVAIITSIALTGGFPTSVAAPVLIVPLIFAFLFFGVRSGAYVGVLTSVLCFCQWLASTTGVLVLPDLTSRANPALNSVMSLAVSYSVTLLALFLYERSNAKIKRERDDERAQLAALAHSDSVTGLPNARYFQLKLDRACDKADVEHSAVAVHFLDLNGFKQVNDRHGHVVGDLLLQRVAQVLRKTLAEEAVVARLGGDEFAVLMELPDGAEQAAASRAAIHAALSKPLDIGGRLFEMSASVGTAIYPQQVEKKQHLLEMADLAMYRVKRRTRLKQQRGEATQEDYIGSKSA